MSRHNIFEIPRFYCSIKYWLPAHNSIKLPPVPQKFVLVYSLKLRLLINKLFFKWDQSFFFSFPDRRPVHSPWQSMLSIICIRTQTSIRLTTVAGVFFLVHTDILWLVQNHLLIIQNVLRRLAAKASSVMMISLCLPWVAPRSTSSRPTGPSLTKLRLDANTAAGIKSDCRAILNRKGKQEYIVQHWDQLLSKVQGAIRHYQWGSKHLPFCVTTP